MKNITIFHLKIIIFTALKNRSILHGRVFVMSLFHHGVLVDLSVSILMH